jgi:DNA-binding response OmpR family regulator
MLPLDKDIEKAHALVIDGNPASRSIITAQLRDIGVPNVVQVPRLADGRRRLEARHYDIVICELVFPGEDTTGQELLEDLRRSNLLPYDTVFVMVTGEARYERVVEAAESALDSYLLKPYAATTLSERLRQARHRKRSLGKIFSAIEQGELEQAAALCLQRYREQGEYWLYAARVGAELLLRLGRHELAGQLYQAIADSRAVPWARLGVARSQADAGQLGSARRSLESLLTAEPDYADAWDVMGRVQIEQGNLDEALDTYRKAASLTPGSIPRLQKQGLLAFYNGDNVEAERLLDRAALIGASSKLFDMQSLVVLAFTRFRLKDSKGLQRCRENLEHFATRGDDPVRRQRFVAVAACIELLAAGRVAEAQQRLTRLADERRSTELDVEAACNLLALMAEFSHAGQAADDAETWIFDLAQRFATSRSVGELLSRSVSRHPPYLQIIEQGHSTVLSLSEKAMNHALEGQPLKAVQSLMEAAQTTLNAKLIDTAGATLLRYRQKIDGADGLQQRIDTVRRQYAASWAAPRLGQGGRAEGGLLLRTRAPTPDAEAEPAKKGSPAPVAATAA